MIILSVSRMMVLDLLHPPYRNYENLSGMGWRAADLGDALTESAGTYNMW